MSWNVQQFGQNKINNAQVAACIVSTIYAPNVGAPALVPDILVVQEVGARGTAVGAVPAGSGAIALNTLYGLLQAQNANWRCVPPINLGQDGRAEAIGVFYLNTSVTFTGPHRWCNLNFPIPNAQFAAQTAPWTAEFGGVVPVGAAFGGPWNQAPFNAVPAPAPQMLFPNAANNGFVNFPDTDFRRPLRTTFTRVVGGGVIDLWSVHTTPYNAPVAMANLTTVPDMGVAVAAGATRIVCGDTNINAANAGQYAATYGAYTAAGYVPQLGTAGASSINPPTPTMFVDEKPLIGGYLSNLSVDNFITLVNGVVINGAWVVNRVTGAPVPFASDLNTPFATIAAMVNPGARASSFRSWANFGHIGNRHGTGNATGAHGASDHLPILLQLT